MEVLVLAYQKMAWSSPSELARYSSATRNLACAEGIPGTDHWDNQRCLGRLKEIAQKVQWKTHRNIRRFKRDPASFYHSEIYYRMLVLASTVQQDFGIQYNPDKIPEEVPLTVEDTFVYGAVLGPGGTCASLPVVYATIGDYVGYPLYLVSAKTPKWTHLFVRWDDGQTRMNFETTARGLITDLDDHYRTAPYDVTPEDEAAGGFLKSMTPREELASFLVERYHCWKDAGNQRRGVEALAFALALSPSNVFFRHTLNHALDQWQSALDARKPHLFPVLEIDPGPPRFPASLPVKVERDILALEATENLLNNPDHDRNWWAPIRCGNTGVRVPTVAKVRFGSDGTCNITANPISNMSRTITFGIIGTMERN
jgi:hypothetical protein